MADLAFSIDTFTEKLASGGALGSLFQCNLVTAKGSGSVINDFKFLCKGATLPGSAVEAATVTYMGRAIQLPGNRAAAQLTTSIYNDEGMEIRNNIESWMEQLNSHKTNVRAAAMTQIQSYTGTLKVKTFGKAGGVIPKSYEFIDAWPSAIGEITVDWETNDIQTYDVTWEFSYWKSAQSNTGF